MLLEHDAVIGALSTLLVAIKERRRAIRPKAPVIMSPTVYHGSSPIPAREECDEHRLMGLDNADPIETALEQAVRRVGEILARSHTLVRMWAIAEAASPTGVELAIADHRWDRIPRSTGVDGVKTEEKNIGTSEAAHDASLRRRKEGWPTD